MDWNDSWGIWKGTINFIANGHISIRCVCKILFVGSIVSEILIETDISFNLNLFYITIVPNLKILHSQKILFFVI